MLQGDSFCSSLASLQLSPGEHIPLDIQAYDELNHTYPALVSVTEIEVDDTKPLLQLENTFRELAPLKKKSPPFSYHFANEALYKELANNTVHRFQVIDIFSALKNRFLFNVTAIPCRPGFKFEYDKCTCDENIEGLLR